MKYQVRAVINFTVDADSRAEAHVEAANRLIEADFAGFDLANLDISGPVKSTDHAADTTLVTNSVAPGRYAGKDGPVTVVAPRPDFSSLDPTPLDEASGPAYAPMPVD